MAGPSGPRTAWKHRYLLVLAFSGCVPWDSPLSMVLHEQRHIRVRAPSMLPPVPIPPIPPPTTVLEPPPPGTVPSEMTLDDAIRVGLANSGVVRVLTGVTATSSGNTIYDAAISNTDIDFQSGVFNPVFTLQNPFGRFETPVAVPAPNLPAEARIGGDRVDNADLNINLLQRTITGGTFSLDVLNNASRFRPNVAILSPQDRYSAGLSLTQPLLQGAGVARNLAPIVIARINTERSFFQYKASVQDLVRGIIEAYWAIVFARTDVWARRQQVEQGKVAYERAEARQRQGFGNAAEVAQTRLALANFRVSLIGSEANMLLREDALRNILGMSPSEPVSILPMTPPETSRLVPDWAALLRLAEQRRPDILELKLIIEADRQALLIASNQALPQLDVTGLYRWNGLEGETPGGDRLSSRRGQFTDSSIGINFSVPLGLRSARANLRRADLVLLRDQANLQQGLHNASHLLSLSVRNLAQYFAQYETLKVTREAASVNLEQQLAEFRTGRAIFLNVLQAISDWGNSVSNEAQTLSLYNTELANLERQTGTILETHGVRFFEERFLSVGPTGRLTAPWAYPAALDPSPNAPRYPISAEPAEAALEREKPGLPVEPEAPPDPLLPEALPFEANPAPGDPM